MIFFIPKILGVVLLLLLFLIFTLEVLNSYGYSFAGVSDSFETELAGPSQRSKKQFQSFFSLYSNMDIIRSQNSDVIPSRTTNLTADEICNSTNVCLKAFVKYETRYRVAPDYKMVHCVVHKSMSTVITGIMCYLFNRTKFVAVDKKGNMSEWDKAAFCRGSNTHRNFKGVMKKYKINNTDEWNLSIIKREPIDRFISGYVDRCIRAPQERNSCNGCDKNLTCFVIAEYERFQNQTKKRYLANSFEDRHFYPQNWRCDLRKFRSKYEFIRYSSDPSKELMTDLFKIARRQGVPEEELSYIENELTLNRKTSHTTAYSPAREFYEKRLRENPFLMEYVVKMFYYDFVILGYPFPDGFQ